MFNKLKNGQPFSFSKYADGEWSIIQGHHLNNGEFEFCPQTVSFYRDKLIESFKYKNKNYYVGISCPCCQGNESQKMIDFSEQDTDHLTFANIFVNANYPIYLETFIKQYKNHDVHLIANKNSKIENLPFKIEKFYPVGFSAWTNNYNLINQIKQNNLSNKLFLFCAGPFGNMLAHQLPKIFVGCHHVHIKTLQLGFFSQCANNIIGFKTGANKQWNVKGFGKAHDKR